MKAEAECASFGAELAPLTASDTASKLSTLMGHGYSQWLGYSDVAEEGKWVDKHGNEHKNMPWKAGEPNGGTSENYALLYSNPPGLVNDWCSTCKARFHCVQSIPGAKAYVK